MPLSPDCASREDLRALAVAVLQAAGIVEPGQVRDFHAQPVDLSSLPLVVVATPAERKDTAGDGAPQFLTTVSLVVVIRLSDTCEASAETLIDQAAMMAEAALLGSASFLAPIQRVEFVETQTVVSVDGETKLGEATIVLGCVVPQLYLPDAGAPLLGLHMTIPARDDGAPVVFDIPLPQ